MNQQDFFIKLVESDGVKEFLSTFSTLSEKGYAYEMVCNILTKFGFIEYFKPGKSIKHYEGNIDQGLGGLKEVVSLDYLVSGATTYKKTKTGSSDITVKSGDKYHFCSVKYRNDVKLMLKDYEVDRIVNKMIGKECDYEVVLFVKSREIVHEKMRATQSDKNLIEKIGRVIGLDEIEDSFQRFKKRINESCPESYTTDFLLRERDFLELRFHQEMLVNKTQTLIKNGHKDILWGCKPRSGKTYMAAGLIRMMDKNVLITTNHPTEVREEFIKLFTRYEDFRKFQVCNIKTKEELDYIKGLKKEDKKIVFVSKQLLQTMDYKTLKNKFSLTIYDENHDGGTTEISNDILKQVGGVIVYMTGTPLKSIRKWNIDEKARLMWTLEDEKMCKNIMDNVFETQPLIDKFGKDASELIDVYIKHSILDERFKYYKSMPSIHYMTVMFNKERYTKLVKETSESVYGFSFKTLFSLSESMSRFQYEEEVKLFLRYLSGSQKYVDFKNGDESIFRRISTLIQKENSRSCKTQLWFLPPNNIDEVSSCLKKLMEMDELLKKYTVLLVNSKRNISDVRLEIEKAEEKGNVIILAGSMLQLGVSIPNCDVVMLFHDSHNVDKVIQQSYRSMTESKGKEIGIVVDLNPGRILEMIHSISNDNSGIKNILEYNYKYNLINIDLDMFDNKKVDQDWIIESLVKEWLSMPIHSYTNILKRLDQEMGDIHSETEQLIYECFNKVTSSQSEFSLSITEKKKESLGKGISRDLVTFDDEPEELEVIDVDNEIKKIVVIFKREILPYAIQLVTVLTIDQNMNDFISMLKWIKNDNELVLSFEEQTNRIWKQKNVIDLILSIAKKLELGTINDICLSIRLKINAMIDYPEELLKLLNDCLKPKEVEKKDNGEVFTPISMVNEMLDTLPKDVWSNKKLKWYDPANGLGNYPIVVYLRLMEGLKESIPDENERKKHILENMLYMAEMNKKNIIISKFIINVGNEYKLNLYHGDSLALDIEKEWGVKKFDVVIGNPPYNTKFKNNKGAEPLYNKFIEKYIDKCRWLLFIVPSRWFAGGKGLDQFRKNMLERNDIKLIKHYKNASSIFGNKVSIEGGVNYFLKDEKHKGMCDFNGTMITLSKYDILVDPKYYKFIESIENFPTLMEIYMSQGYFKIETNDKRLEEKPGKDYVKCYVSQQKGFIKYIHKKHIVKENSYKVVTARANGGKPCFGNMFISSPDEVYTSSYIAFRCKSKEEAEYLLSYLQCKITNTLLSMRKISQDISEKTCKWIPLVSLDRIWTDEQLADLFNLEL